MKDKTKVVTAGGHMEDSVVKQLHHGECGAAEGGCAGRGTHWTSVSLVYICTCTVHEEVHNNDM